MFIRPILLAGAALAASQASAVTRSWPARGFDRVDLAAAAAVNVRTGPAFAVTATGAPELLEHLDVGVRNSTLVIAWQRGFRPRNMRRNELRVAVTLPRVAGATVSGAGEIAIDRVDGPDFDGRVGGAGSLKLASLRTRHAGFTMSGAGQVVAAGAIGQLDARVTGVGQIDAGALAARGGRIDLSGTGSVRARIDGPAMVTMSGIGQVTVLGRPQCTVRKSGLGSVHCGA